LRPDRRPPLVVVVDRDFDLGRGEERLGEADAVVVRVAADALSRTCAAVCRRARRGQTIVLASCAYIGATRELLIEPLTELGFAVGEDISVACSPEPGAAEQQRYLAASGKTCVARARLAIAPFAAAVETVPSFEEAELAPVLAELAAGER
jgi:UDP-N-acetyl-D-mannosaminuronate dehydrogenase